MVLDEGIGVQQQPERCLEADSGSCESALKTADTLSRALNDRYRFPKGFLNFALDGNLSTEKGYFRFGSNAICYGRSTRGKRKPEVGSDLYDALNDVTVNDGKLTLPFDPSEVIDNLRLERYASGCGARYSFENILRKLYYLVRPLTNPRVRRQVKRFRASNWNKLPFPQWPVDTTVENICQRLLRLSMAAKGVDRVPFVWFWPQGAQGCVVMTHDVETEAGRDACAALMDLDDEYGIKASFNIVPEERYTVSSAFLAAVRSRGFEIGIQDLNHDGWLFDGRKEFLRRAKIINRYASDYGAEGFRAGALYRNPEWYHAFSFSFDMSIPNVAHLDPQRGGCCTVMPYFIGDILELPVTTTQDYMLFHLLNHRSIALWKNQIDLILKSNGLASFIVHPDYVLEPDTRSIYQELLNNLRRLRQETNVWFALPAKVNRWWRARSQMRIVRDGDSWRIVGQGAHRAVLAYANNVDGKLVYQLAPTPGNSCAADDDIISLE